MSDNYTVLTTVTELTSSSASRTKSVTAAASLTEVFWAQVQLEAAASDVVLKMNLLTDPLILVVFGDTGVSFKLDSTGTDALAADPINVISDEGAGLGIDEILLSNSDSVAHEVTIIAFE